LPNPPQGGNSILVNSFPEITLKEFERRTDGILEPKDPKMPVYIAEFQAQHDNNIYHRLVMEMSSYAMEKNVLDIRGILVFFTESLDPKSNPWHYLFKSSSKLLTIVYLDDYLKKLEKINPNHPMVIVFKQIFEKDEKVIQKNANRWYNTLIKSRINKMIKNNIEKIFISWLSARFNHLSYMVVIKMIADITEFEQTRF